MWFLETEMLQETEEIVKLRPISTHPLLCLTNWFFRASNQFQPWEESPRFHIELICKICLKPTASSDYSPFFLKSNITAFNDSSDHLIMMNPTL